MVQVRFILTGVLILFSLIAAADTLSPQQEDTMQDTEIADQIAIRFPDAPDAVVAIARTIAAGGVPDAAALGGIDKDTLNASYSRPFPDRQPGYGHTLLREAVLAQNTAAAEALIQQGANPFFNDNEMPYLALRIFDTGGPRLWFPDYTKSNAMLRLWLASGGPVDAVHGGVSTGSLLIAAPLDNLEAVLLLLEAGADPWERHPLSAGSSLIEPSYFEELINANVQSLEVAFRVAKEGHFANPDPDTRPLVVEQFENTAAFLEGSTGPANLAKIWALQRVMDVALPQMDVTPTGVLADIRAVAVPDHIGGFFLAEGELHSPDDADQRVDNDNQTGTERWDG